MSQLQYYHNSRCSKSRQGLALLREHGENPEVIEYLKKPLTFKQLQVLRQHFPINDFVRTNEAIYRELKLSLNDENQVLAAMVEHPILMQRPIAVKQGKAVIGRPPEKVLDLLE